MNEPETPSTELEDAAVKLEKENREISSVIVKLTFLCSALAVVIALWVARQNGCDWLSAIWRSALAAVGCALAGQILLGPLYKTLQAPPPEQKVEAKAPTGVNGPVPAPAPVPVRK